MSGATEIAMWGYFCVVLATVYICLRVQWWLLKAALLWAVAKWPMALETKGDRSPQAYLDAPARVSRGQSEPTN